jgi:hypothetical protein
MLGEFPNSGQTCEIKRDDGMREVGGREELFECAGGLGGEAADGEDAVLVRGFRWQKSFDKGTAQSTVRPSYNNRSFGLR